MYLTEIADVDDSWPEEDAECVLKLHTALGKQALREVHARVSRADIQAAVAHMPSLGAAGFDPLAPVSDADVHLITRLEASDDEEEEMDD